MSLSIDTIKLLNEQASKFPPAVLPTVNPAPQYISSRLDLDSLPDHLKKQLTEGYYKAERMYWEEGLREKLMAEGKTGLYAQISTDKEDTPKVQFASFLGALCFNQTRYRLLLLHKERSWRGIQKPTL